MHKDGLHNYSNKVGLWRHCYHLCMLVAFPALMLSADFFFFKLTFTYKSFTLKI